MCFLLIDGAVMVANMKAKKFVNKLESLLYSTVFNGKFQNQNEFNRLIPNPAFGAK